LKFMDVTTIINNAGTKRFMDLVASDAAARAANQANFYKNIAMMGAYLLLAVTGAGRYSFDHRSVAVASKPAAATA
jgi:uncharacterized membrane protein YphA (DoxX/SURF4 family)